jgi:hypothetical protein
MHRYAFVVYTAPESRSAALAADLHTVHGLMCNPATPRAPVEKKALLAEAVAAVAAAHRKTVVAVTNAAPGCAAQVAAAMKARTDAQAAIALERTRVVDDLRAAVVATLGSSTTVELFGSAATGLGYGCSDLDATVLINDATRPIDTSRMDTWPADPTPAITALSLLVAHLKQSPCFCQITLVRRSLAHTYTSFPWASV